jgi:arginine-tRNA-protein transferase
MYHRIDGKLAAVGYIDILSDSFDSCYFIYDPEYRFLNIGVVGALIEIEYMRMVQEHYNPHMRYYILGDLNLNCSKVSYKLNYQPGGLIQCPTTFEWIPVAEALPVIQIIQSLSLEEK